MSRLEVAVEMAKIFRDKHDFSTEDNWTAWVKQSFEAADRMIAEDKRSTKIIIPSAIMEESK